MSKSKWTEYVIEKLTDEKVPRSHKTKLFLGISSCYTEAPKRAIRFNSFQKAVNFKKGFITRLFRILPVNCELGGE